MKELSQIEPFANKIEIVHLMPVRFIVKEVRNGSEHRNTASTLRGRKLTSGDHTVLENHPQVLSNDLFGLTCKYDFTTKTFIYIVCVLNLIGTLVPDDFTYRDVPKHSVMSVFTVRAPTKR